MREIAKWASGLLFVVCVVLPLLEAVAVGTPIASEQVKVALELEGVEGWEREVAEEDSRSAFLHTKSGIRAELWVIDGSKPAYRQSSEAEAATGTQIVADWDQQFRHPQPLVEVVEHSQVQLGGVNTLFGHLEFQDRIGIYYGFSSADIAASMEGTVDQDRYAYFLLVEGPAKSSEELESLLEEIQAHLKIRL